MMASASPVDPNHYSDFIGDVLSYLLPEELKEAFRETPVGVTMATQTNHDLILDIRHLRNLLNSTIQMCHSHGYESSSTHPILSAPLNVAFIQDPSIQNHSKAVDTSPLSHVITLLHNSAAYNGDIKTKIHELENQQNLQLKVQKDNQWSDAQFHAVNWAAYYQAYRRVTRSHRISIMKLSHQLWNTNSQNEKFYGQPNTCPICSQHPETVNHVYHCQQSAAVTHCTQALKSLSTTLQNGTPKVLLDVILDGLQQWSKTGDYTAIKASTASSCLPSLHIITEAFNLQTELGWGSFYRGPIATQWREAYKQNYRPKKPLTDEKMDIAADKWCRLVITTVWTYSKKLWQFHNQVVHGKTEVNKASKALAQLQARAAALYEQFSTDPYMLPASRTYLFHWPLSTTVNLSQEVLASRVGSVEEDLYTREHREPLEAAALKRTLHNFFLTKSTARKTPPAWRGSLWKSPFSTSFYRRHQAGTASGGKKAECRSNTGHRTKVKMNRKKVMPPGQSLLSFGFQLLRPQVKVTKRDSHTEKLEEFSCTRLSTAP